MVIHSTMNSASYHRVLEDNLRIQLLKWTFQLDNDHKQFPFFFAPSLTLTAE